MCSVVRLLFCSTRGEIFHSFSLLTHFTFIRLKTTGTVLMEFPIVQSLLGCTRYTVIWLVVERKLNVKLMYGSPNVPERPEWIKPGHTQPFFFFACHLVLIEIKEISQITDLGKSQFKRSILRRNHNLAKFSKKNGRRLGHLETVTLLEPFLPTYPSLT